MMPSRRLMTPIMRSTPGMPITSGRLFLPWLETSPGFPCSMRDAAAKIYIYRYAGFAL